MSLKIYRGVSGSLDAQNGGKILRKGTRDELEVEFGDDNACFGIDSLEFGSSPSNAQYFHNICSDTYQTSYVSFTTSEDRARWFATNENTESGWVYVTDTDLLENVGIGFKSEPGERVNSHEAEILVNLIVHDHLPEDLIIEKYRAEQDI